MPIKKSKSFTNYTPLSYSKSTKPINKKFSKSTKPINKKSSKKTQHVDNETYSYVHTLLDQGKDTEAAKIMEQKGFDLGYTDFVFRDLAVINNCPKALSLYVEPPDLSTVGKYLRLSGKRNYVEISTIVLKYANYHSERLKSQQLLSSLDKFLDC